MALSPAKKISETVNSQLVNSNTLYIDKNAMDIIKANLKKDMASIDKSWEDLYTITSKTVKNKTFAGNTEKAFNNLAKKAKTRANKCVSQSKTLSAKIKEATDKYEMNLLNDRISELEAKLNTLINSQN